MAKGLGYTAMGLFLIIVVAFRVWGRSRGTPWGRDVFILLALIVAIAAVAGLASRYTSRKNAPRV